ncbi:MAG: S-methyl-5-thioribose-1-phosphate isomerase [Alphaproteobacteria bacterium]|nr:S-methyl-5-thioribose-1-phosphate isomerase [Alphaproteobacteria bacterium]
MKVEGRPTRTIWLDDDGWSVGILDQTKLPFRLERISLKTLEDAARAIADMEVRGAPLIGVTAAYGVALAMRTDASDPALKEVLRVLLATRPTAVNLRWALEDMAARLEPLAPGERMAAAYARAAAIADEDVAQNEAIGRHGLPLIEAARQRKGAAPVNVLTHCNAGWLATVDWGTALAPIYMAHDAGIPVHVWVDETRPRNQGAGLTAWELGQHGVPYTVIVDNAGGHLMQQGEVDLCIVGTDRTTGGGDVCNKIGTYLKALAAFDNGVPFYVALPGTTIDWRMEEGVGHIPIEERDAAEVATVTGSNPKGEPATVRLLPEGGRVKNVAFDVTPARLVTGLITERGIAKPSRVGLEALYPEHRAPREKTG